ncbi:MAG: M36 family metallopeptidase [Chitinophagaceae bacterium]|nr:M36 family metallopeptidase [Chitinophagaceae bacterium]
MKKIFLFLMPLLFCVFSMNAQTFNAEENAAISLVSASKASLGLSADDMNNVQVSSTYYDNTAGVRMVYLNQTYQSIPVYNQMLVLAFKGEKLVSQAGTFNRGVAKWANVKTVMPSVTAESAVQSALADRGLHASQMAIALNKNGNKIEFGKMGISQENITAQLMWTPIENTNEIRLSWHIYIVPKTTPDYWMVRVDAVNNSILGMDNYTVYDNWGTPDVHGKVNYPAFAMNKINVNESLKNVLDFRKTDDPSLVTTATYRVIPIPYESPNHMPAPMTTDTRTDPWLQAGVVPNAVTLKWHTGAGAADYDYTRSNNVWAYQDRTPSNNTGTIAKSASSTTAFPNLTFNFVPDFAQEPTVTAPTPNQQFNITNLFYWNNVIHDVFYGYGFDEVSGNFQDDNLGRGGAGNDHVNGEAQDGSGSNNANFSTPADGGSGRMQMYLWTAPTPDRDGDVDNGIIIHEHGHGISIRLTGGPANSGCLGNAEQGGEGWADYFGIMLTQNWATSTVTSGFTSPRGVGTYALNQPTTGVGIRPARYCTDLAINNYTYANLPSMAIPHGVGFIWCTILWDMTWNIINQTGIINPNIYDITGTGGNTIALKLVTEACKIQQCSPGFVSARNAILQADQILYGGTYNCAIWEAFRRRGVGAFASEGSTGSINDQIVDFTPPITLGALVSATTIPEGGTLVYTNSVATCSAVSGYTLRDTIPTNVTYVSGGTYDAVNRVVSFAVSQGAGTTNYPFTVSVNAGSYFPPSTLINEPVATATIPASWTTTAPLGTVWSVSTTVSNSAPNSFYVQNLAADGDQRLATTAAIALPANSYPELSFWHRFNTEDGWDGGVVEISNNAGATWNDVGAENMTLGAYNGALGTSPNNPIGGRAAFTGLQTTFINTKINLAAYAGQSVMIRFRFGSDNNTSAPTSPAGWWVDDITLIASAAVPMRSSLFNATNTRVSFKDMVTLITPNTACNATITQHPVDVSACAGNSVTYTCLGTATGGVTYQWQVSTAGAGGPYSNLTNAAPYSGVTTTTLTINPTTAVMNGNYYRCVVTGTCPPAANSTPALLSVAAASTPGTVAPAVSQVCGTTNSGTITLSGQVGNVIRWESATAPAGPWTPIVNTTTTYTYTNITQTMYYRAVVQFGTCAAAPSTVATVNFTASAALLVIADPGTTICEGDPTLLTVVEGFGTQSVNAPAPITINNSGPATPYPSNLTVVGFPTSGISVKSVTLTGLSHTWAGDLDIVLQSPTGQNVMLLSDAGGSADFINNTMIFDDAAPGIFTTPPPANATATVRPTNTAGPDNFPAPGPTGVPANPTLSTFTGDFNGVWKLFINDQAAGDQGNVTGGYSVTFVGPPAGPVTGGTFTWAPPGGLSSTTSNPVAASPMNTTTYTVSHNNGAGCIRQANITITVNKRPVVTTQPTDKTVCNTLPVTFTVAGTGTALTYQWQERTTPAGAWTNLTNAAPYSGVTTATLTINPVAIGMNGYAYRCVLSGTCAGVANANISNPAVLTVLPLPTVTVTPSAPTCGGVAGSFGTALTASGANTYSWSPIAGLFIDPNAVIPYTGTSVATVYAAPTVFTAYTVTGTSTTTGCSNTATVLINYTPPAPTVTPNPVAMCLGDAAVRLISSSAIQYSTSATSGTISLAVPDNTANGVSNNLTISGIPANGTISNISVTLNMSHTYPGDMIIHLKAPNGQILNLYKYGSGLFTGPASGVSTWGWYGAKVSQLGSTAWSTVATAPFIYNNATAWKADAINTPVAGPTVQNPTGFVSNAAGFASLYTTGPSANGTWTLAMADGGPGDIGTLASWSLNVDYFVGVASTQAVWTPNGAGSGLFTDAAATTVYTGTPRDTVWAKPTPSGVYNYDVTVQSVGLPPSTIQTSFTNNNQFGLVTSNFTNNNAFPVTITGIESVASASGASNATLFYKTTPVAGAPGAISAANGWIQAGTGSYTAVANTTTTVPQPMLSGLSLTIPAGATYGIAFQTVLASGGTGNLRYSTVAAGTYTSTGGGCVLTSGTSVSYAGGLAPAAPTFTPRAFIGKVLFGSSVITCTSPARRVVVTVNEPTVLNAALPADKTICTDKVTTFTATVTIGSGPHSYQWQVSTNGGGSFSNISNGGVYSGATTATLTVTAPPVTMDNYQYRCVVTGASPCAAKTSRAATLRVNPLPVIVVTANPYTSLFPGLQTTLSATVSPNAAATYDWTRNGISLSGSSQGVVSGIGTANLTVDVDGMGDYRLNVTDVNGCNNNSNIVTIKDSASANCFLYPNPTDGRFDVRYFSVANNTNLPRFLNVYTSAGVKVLTQNYAIGRPYDRMSVDLRNQGKGLYLVEIADVNGNRLSVCKVVIQ